MHTKFHQAAATYRARAHDARRVHRRREFPHLGPRNFHRCGPLLLLGERWQRGRHERDESTGGPGETAQVVLTVHVHAFPVVVQAMAAASRAGTSAASVECSPSRNRLGIRNHVKAVPIVMPPATTAASPR